MTPANRTKLEKASSELAGLAKQKISSQDLALALFRTLELVQGVLIDLLLRPAAHKEEHFARQEEPKLDPDGRHFR